MSTESSPSAAPAGPPYVPAIVAKGEFIFVSGQVPLRDGQLIEPSIEAQVEVVLRKIEAILRDGGASLHDVVRCGVYLTDLDALPQVNEIYERIFDGHRPTRTTVGVTLPGYDVEIDCIAVVPGNDAEHRDARSE